MTRRHYMILLAAAAGLVCVISGCGYSSESLFPKDVKTVDVPIWTVGKSVFRRELEFRLTEALKKRISGATPYRIAAKGKADTQLTGTIELIRQPVLSHNPDTSLPREIDLTLKVSFKWVDPRSGDVRAQHAGFEVTGSYIPDPQFGEDFFQGSESVINKLARRVVEQLEADW